MAENINGDNILGREETKPILDSSENTIDLDKRLRNISKLLVLGVFFQPLLDFSDSTFSIASLTVHSFL